MAQKKAQAAKKSKGKQASKPAAAPKRKGTSTPVLTPTVEVLPDERKGAKSPALTKKGRPSVIDYDALHRGELDEETETENETESDSESDSEKDSDFDYSEAPADDAKALAPQSIDTAVATASHAISPTDPLRRYLDEVRRYPLLTPEEEIALATKLHATGDLEAAKRLVQANLRLVVKIAFEYKSVYANVMDLIQEGNIGLMKAVSKYDPTKGAKVSYYSSWWIRSYILKYLLDNFRLVRVGTTAAQKKLFFHLMREKERLEAQGVFAGPKLLADKLNVREKDVVEMEKRLGHHGTEVSLDAPVGTDHEGERRGSYVDLLEDHKEATDEQLAREQLLDLIRDRIPDFEKTLNDRERKLLRDRLLSEEPKTLQEVADLYGLTRERARQIEAGVIAKLREYLRDSMR
ncbi:MAG: RNA polymerase factor sigma-32 [Bdellovibrionales bacterium]|nr:RNA polymerase factor sigma-32 [Bdellovibrionales bacterium]